MRLLAEEASKATTSNFDYFDIFIILFTIVIAIAVARELRRPVKNKFAIGFGIISLLVFLVMDVVMIQNWLG